MKKLTYLKCSSCGWIHFSVTRKYAENHVKKYNEFMKTQTKEVRKSYGNRKLTIDEFEICNVCPNHYKNFVKATDKEIKSINGCTVSPIINPRH